MADRRPVVDDAITMDARRAATREGSFHEQR